jgi:hypothetical protein
MMGSTAPRTVYRVRRTAQNRLNSWGAGDMMGFTPLRVIERVRGTAQHCLYEAPRHRGPYLARAQHSTASTARGLAT